MATQGMFLTIEKQSSIDNLVNIVTPQRENEAMINNIMEYLNLVVKVKDLNKKYNQKLNDISLEIEILEVKSDNLSNKLYEEYQHIKKNSRDTLKKIIFYNSLFSKFSNLFGRNKSETLFRKIKNEINPDDIDLWTTIGNFDKGILNYDISEFSVEVDLIPLKQKLIKANRNIANHIKKVKISENLFDEGYVYEAIQSLKSTIDNLTNDFNKSYIQLKKGISVVNAEYKIKKSNIHNRIINNESLINRIKEDSISYFIKVAERISNENLYERMVMGISRKLTKLSGYASRLIPSYKIDKDYDLMGLSKLVKGVVGRLRGETYSDTTNLQVVGEQRMEKSASIPAVNGEAFYLLDKFEENLELIDTPFKQIGNVEYLQLPENCDNLKGLSYGIYVPSKIEKPSVDTLVIDLKPDDYFETPKPKQLTDGIKESDKNLEFGDEFGTLRLENSDFDNQFGSEYDTLRILDIEKDINLQKAVEDAKSTLIGYNDKYLDLTSDDFIEEIIENDPGKGLFFDVVYISGMDTEKDISQEDFKWISQSIENVSEIKSKEVYKSRNLSKKENPVRSKSLVSLYNASEDRTWKIYKERLDFVEKNKQNFDFDEQFNFTEKDQYSFRKNLDFLIEIKNGINNTFFNNSELKERISNFEMVFAATLNNININTYLIEKLGKFRESFYEKLDPIIKKEITGNYKRPDTIAA